MKTTIASPALAPAPSFNLNFMSVLNWLATKDQAYRDAQSMRNLPSHVLNDVGLETSANGLRRS